MLVRQRHDRADAPRQVPAAWPGDPSPRGQRDERHRARPPSGAPKATALVDERGLADLGRARPAGRRARPSASPTMRARRARRTARSAILCRNHRGFVESLAAATRLGADALLLNTGFSGPQLRRRARARAGHARGLRRGVRAASSPRPRERVPGLVEVLGLGRRPGPRPTSVHTLDELIDAHRRPSGPTSPSRPGRIVLLTSGTTGTPKGARRSGGGRRRAGRDARADPVAGRARRPSSRRRCSTPGASASSRSRRRCAARS